MKLKIKEMVLETFASGSFIALAEWGLIKY